MLLTLEGWVRRMATAHGGRESLEQQRHVEERGHPLLLTTSCGWMPPPMPPEHTAAESHQSSSDMLRSCLSRRCRGLAACANLIWRVSSDFTARPGCRVRS